jgi:hypothetical protein
LIYSIQIILLFPSCQESEGIVGVSLLIDLVSRNKETKKQRNKKKKELKSIEK